MLVERKEQLNRQAARRKLWLRIKYGCRSIVHNPFRLLGLLPLAVAIIMAVLWCKNYATSGGVVVAIIAEIWLLAVYMLGFLSVLLYVVLNGTPWGANGISDDLHRAGVVNQVEEPPILLERKKDVENPKMEILTLHATGIPLDLWEDKQLAIESALNAFVVRVKEGRTRNTVQLHTVNSEGAFPEIAPWNDGYLSDKDGVLVLGITVAGTQVTVDLSNTPHALIGGSTGSGKSVLMSLMLYQVMAKGDILYLADFKGGLDYNRPPWRGRCEIITTIDRAIFILDKLVAELEIRKNMLFDAGCRNIAMYNNLTGAAMSRIVFGCDEVAELTDKTGLTNKEEKAKIDHIIGQLSTIARQGRALGIHLILATQRPDANVLPGQIKNNIDFRACGRADNTLAIIILDNADAADMLPKDGHRFMTQDGTIFLPYFWEE